MGTRPLVAISRLPRSNAPSTVPSTTRPGTPATPSNRRRARRRWATAWRIHRPGRPAWILEKFWAWTDCDGHPENVLTRDEMLDNLMLYWATNSATSRPASTGRASGRDAPPTVAVPVGVTRVPEGDRPPVRAWMEADYPEHRSLGGATKGGHFAAFEQPELFVDDIRACFRQFR